jgi:drug/metabolite transporter (DMT)-like permease
MLSSSRRLTADLLLLSVAIVWGGTFVVVKESLAETPVFSFLFLRFGIAFLSLLPFVFFRKELRDPAYWRAGLLLGLLYFAAFAAQTFGLLSVGASMSAFLTGLYVIIVPFLLWAIFRHPPKRFAFYASLIAALGLWFLTSPDLSGSGGSFLGRGELLTLLCALLFAFHIIATDRFSRRYDPFPLVTIQLLVVAILSMLASLLREPGPWPASFGGDLLFAILITGFLATSYALLIQTWMQRYTTPARTAIIFAMEPVSAALFGIFVAGEHLTLWRIGGGALIVAAMLLAELQP